MFSDYLTEVLGRPKDVGHELRYNCPFCGENNDFKLYVKVASDSTNGLWQCKKCDNHGSPVKFVMLREKVSFKEALDILEMYDYELDQTFETARDLGITPEEYLLVMLSKTTEIPKEAEEGPEENLVAPPLPPGYKRLIDNINNPEAYPFFAYCMRRGFTQEDIITHNIGYVTESEVKTQSGGSIKLQDHLVFLTHDNQGHYKYWNTRAIGESYVKSINGIGSEGEHSRKTSVFNLNLARLEPCVVLCEGVPDALTIGRSGVCTFGKQVSNTQIDMLVKEVPQTTPIYIFFDNDAVPETVKLCEKLYPRHKELYIVVNPKGHDANDIGREASWDLIRNSSVKGDATGLISYQLAIKAKI